ncbi:MAG: hypothetical protein ACXAB7_13730, partial [Candidatus Kariarchaeaceae archaeon]
ITQEGQSVLECSNCGSAYHEDHLKTWFNRLFMRNCPACKSQLSKLSLQIFKDRKSIEKSPNDKIIRDRPLFCVSCKTYNYDVTATVCMYCGNELIDKKPID